MALEGVRGFGALNWKEVLSEGAWQREGGMSVMAGPHTCYVQTQTTQRYDKLVGHDIKAILVVGMSTSHDDLCT